MGSVNLQIFADYFQVYLEDKQPVSIQREFLFTAQHISGRVWIDQGLIIMFTVRNATVPVEVEVVETEPTDYLALWDHVTEASIDVPSGQIEIYGCGGYDEFTLALPPGTYRARMYHAQLASLRENGLQGDDHYKLVLWSDTVIQPRVSKRWTEPV